MENVTYVSQAGRGGPGDESMTDHTITNGAMPITLAFDDMGVQVVSTYEGHTDMIPVMWSAVPDLITALAQGMGRQCHDAHKACDGFGLQLDKLESLIRQNDSRGIDCDVRDELIAILEDDTSA